jgi:peptidyl-prolyl cis-trans isomerase B (cyclophilin B)
VASTKREKELARQRAARQAARRAERDRRRKQRTAMVASVIAVLLVLGLAGFATVAMRDNTPGQDDQLASEETPDAADPSEAPSEPPAEPEGEGATLTEPAVVGDCTYRPDGQASRPVQPPAVEDIVREGTRQATIRTSQGDLALELLAAEAPCTVGSFASLARQGFYGDTPCHRLVTEGIFVLQCGDPDGTGTGGPGYQFDEENLEGATYPRGTVAMAKTAAPGTSGSQFFLVFQDTPLPPEYTPFARITGGLEVLDAVAAAGAAPQDENGTTAPNTPVQITAVEVA